MCIIYFLRVKCPAHSHYGSTSLFSSVLLCNINEPTVACDQRVQYIRTMGSRTLSLNRSHLLHAVHLYSMSNINFHSTVYNCACIFIMWALDILVYILKCSLILILQVIFGSLGSESSSVTMPRYPYIVQLHRSLSISARVSCKLSLIS